MQIDINSNDRLSVLGKTGSGKTYWAKKVIWGNFDRVIFYDWKRQHYDELAAPVFTKLEEMKEAVKTDKVTKMVYVPDYEEADREGFDELCRFVWDLGNMHLIVDEEKGIYQEGNSTKPITDYHERILTRGRAKGVGITNLSQRPKKIPMETISESEHIVAFRLNLKDDRDRIGEVIGKEHSEKLQKLKGHQYMYYHIGMDKPTISEPI